MPFVGDGDLAVAHYATRPIYGADLDPARVATAQARLPGAVLRVADCDGWPFPDVTTPFAIADFDAYANPYRGLAAFWPVAARTRRIVLFGTDGLRMRIARGQVLKSLPSGAETPASGVVCRAQYNFWWARHVVPWLTALVAPARITTKRFYLRGMGQLYWGVVVEG